MNSSQRSKSRGLKLLKRILPVLILAVVLLLVFFHWPYPFPTPSESEPEMRLQKVNIGIEQIDNAQVKLVNRTELYLPYPGLERKLAAVLEEYSCYRTFHVSSSLGAPREGYTLSMSFQEADGQPVDIHWGGSTLVQINGKVFRCPSSPAMMNELSDLLKDLKPSEVLIEDSNS